MQTGVNRGLVTEIAREERTSDTRVRCRQRSDDVAGPITRAIVDKDDFDVVAEGAKGGGEAAVQFIEDLFLVEHRDDDRDQRRGGLLGS